MGQINQGYQQQQFVTQNQQHNRSENIAQVQYGSQKQFGPQIIPQTQYVPQNTPQQQNINPSLQQNINKIVPNQQVFQ